MERRKYIVGEERSGTVRTRKEGYQCNRLVGAGLVEKVILEQRIGGGQLAM